MKRRQFIQYSALGASASLGSISLAQSYPKGAVTVILPLQAGSASDVAVRHMSERLAQKFGVGFAVENIAAAAGVVGLDKVAKAKADGQTVAALNNSIMTILPHLQPQNVKVDTRNDFVPITGIANIPTFITVPANSPVKSIKDLLTRARSESGNMTYSSGGVGSPQHLATELLMSMTQIKLTHVPYRGATQAALAVAANEVQVMSMALPLAQPFLPNNKIRFLAYSGLERHPQFRDVPTVNEQGIKGYEYSSWVGFFMHKDTPADIVSILRKESEAIVGLRDFHSQLIRSGLDPWPQSAAQLGKIVQDDYAKWQRVIKDAKIQAT
ncbi:MAG: tripartite tricarboxylate transporter substrate binding protein [Burkholderiales bacterium]|nr:MAG: tripartite tricarboxylate transporter substrate binding protein [Burkholderiales bacterium]